jgi:hypothetical protein
MIIMIQLSEGREKIDKMNEIIRVAHRLEQTGELGLDCWLEFIDRSKVVVGESSPP